MLKKIIGRNISILYRHEYQYIDIKLKKYNLNKVQAEVLLFLKDNDNVNHKEINDFFLFNKATITKIITSLENNEYVTRISNNKDQRYKCISLTEKGINIISNIIEILQQSEKIMIKDIAEEDIEKISTILSQMVENITQEKES
ncbi:MarR family transcriptional regulator [Oceanispirochaeta crateris]|uniref:MarR family transcriptional regulator n=1 Tax=Oceanispirochaeta crateris TaxID=2518645 RepID=A0A5C1QLI8_9SPIO|nr:MarR family transcriptional regulator [Oceanispirochaeta crateris]QEN08188.1 MarR family transcriptional regulator [Oceanispirochaeta crateris]